MDNSLKNIFAVSELRNRILFTLALLGVYRVGHHIPTPGVNTAALTVHAHKYSGKAAEKIAAAGGATEQL